MNVRNFLLKELLFLETIQKMFEHLIWANTLILEELKESEVESKEIIRLFSHILFTEKVWITRLQGLDSSNLPIWSEVDLKVCSQLVDENREILTTYLSRLVNVELDKIVVYKNSKGIEFKNTVREILTHIALHGQHHRGQINTRLREAGFEPVNIDYITFVRIR